jgi:hypothetical protein
MYCGPNGIATMSTAFTPPQIERLKREAKRFARDNSLTHSESLDRIAGLNGYSNWSLLMKHSSPLADVNAMPPWIFRRSTDDMREVLRKVPRDRYRSRDEVAKDFVEPIDERLISAANAVDVAIEYMKCLLTVPRFRVTSGSQALWEMHFWLPYSAHVLEEAGDSRILVNRGYKPVGRTSQEFVVYGNYPHLHLRLTEQELFSVSGPRASLGFLFNDGDLPWRSRENAEAYLSRLRTLQEYLKGRTRSS